MKRQCINPNCTKEVKGRSNKKFCGRVCKMKMNAGYNNTQRSAKRLCNALNEPLIKWKQDYIINYHKERSVEIMARGIQKPVHLIIKFCDEKGLTWFSKPYVPDVRTYSEPIRRDPPKEPIVRPPAVYSNQTWNFPYYIATL